MSNTSNLKKINRSPFEHLRILLPQPSIYFQSFKYIVQAKWQQYYKAYLPQHWKASGSKANRNFF